MPTIRPMTPDDWPAVAQIYAEGIATGHATFEAQVPSWEVFDTSKLTTPRLVLEEQDHVLGWAALSPFSTRPIYRGVAELILYIAAGAKGRGLGRQLLTALQQEADKAGLWTLTAKILRENGASIALHERCGFRIVGTHERLGLMTHGPLAGQWRDIVLMEWRAEA